MAKNDHGRCPVCSLDLNGELIWDSFRRSTGSEVEATRIAKHYYGATRTSGRWCIATSIVDVDKDRQVAWRCPSCNHQWRRR